MGFKKDKHKNLDALAKAQGEEPHKIDGVNHSTRQQCQILAGVGTNLVGMSRVGVQAGSMWRGPPALPGAGEGPVRPLRLILGTTLQGRRGPVKESSEESTQK